MPLITLGHTLSHRHGIVQIYIFKVRLVVEFFDVPIIVMEVPEYVLLMNECWGQSEWMLSPQQS